ncbi:MAG: hypothetical protein ABFS16_12935 [Bacteroidota bacterium]
MKFILILSLAMVVSFWAVAQITDTTQVAQENTLPKPGLDKSKIYYGGYMTMSLGKYTVIGAQPLVGYKFTPKLSIGGQVSYEYISDKRYLREQNGSNYGASIFSRYRISPRLYTHTEFSLMSYKWFYDIGDSERKWAPMLYVGGGYSQPVARNTWLNAQVLFDVINHKNSPYRDWEPYFSVGIGVGF